MREGVKKHIIILFLFFFISLLYAEERIPINFTGDFLEYDRPKGIVKGKGNIKVTYKDIVFNCDEIWLNLLTKDIDAKGNVLLKDKRNSIKGEEAVYNLERRTGKFIKPQGHFNEWYFKGKILVQVDPKRLIIYNGYLTTCSLIPPHYKIKAKKIDVILNKKLVAKSISFWVGDFPIFYFPIYWKSLKKKRLTYSIRIGSDEKVGEFLKTEVSYLLTDATKGRLYLDWMSKKGVGKGLKYEYKLSSIKGSLYGYYIKEKDTHSLRWDTQVKHWQMLNSKLYLQADTHYMSDQRFNWDYNRTKITPNELFSSIALTKYSSNYTLRILGKRRDIYEEEEGKYLTVEGYAPELKMAFLPYRFAKNTYFVFNQTAGNYLLRDKDTTTYKYGPQYTLLKTEANAQIKNVIFFTKRNSLTTVLGLEPIWKNRTSQNKKGNIFYSRGFTVVTLHNRINRFLDIDIEQQIEGKIEKEERLSENRLTLIKRFRYYYWVDWVTSLPYDFRDSKMMDIVSEIRYIPTLWFRTYIKGIYSVDQKSLKNIDLEFKFGPKNSFWYIATQTNYFSEYQDRLDLTYKIGFWLTKKWRIETTFRDYLYTKHGWITSSDSLERYICLYRDLHCWEASLSWRKRPASEEIWVVFNIKAFPKTKTQIYHNIEENQWHIRRVD